jgi:glutamine synthetase adenylyltransferase
MAGGAPSAPQFNAMAPNAIGNLMGNPQQMQGMMNMMQSNPQIMEQATRMMSDPAMMAQVQQMMQNPAVMGGMSPNAQQMLQNPQMMQHMQQMMQNPQAMQAMMQMGAAMQGGQGGYANSPFGAPGVGGAPSPFAQMAQQMAAAAPPAGAGDGGNAAANPIPGPMDRMRFAMQLQQLAAMGFADEEKCLRALSQCQGNVERALDVLFAQ